MHIRRKRLPVVVVLNLALAHALENADVQARLQGATGWGRP